MPSARKASGASVDDELKLTNLDKPLFQPRTAVEGETRVGEGPDAKPITKRELIGYYARIAPVDAARTSATGR